MIDVNVLDYQAATTVSTSFAAPPDQTFPLSWYAKDGKQIRPETVFVSLRAYNDGSFNVRSAMVRGKRINQGGKLGAEYDATVWDVASSDQPEWLKEGVRECIARAELERASRENR